MSDFYVYAYLRSRDSETAATGTPYYIGKGRRRRAYNKHNNTPTPKDKANIVLLEQNLTEVEAHDLEVELIAKYGRKDIKSGILHNRTDGGEGASGAKGQVPWNKGKQGLQEAWNKGKTGYLTDEQRAVIGEATRARGPQSAELIAKRSAAMIGKNKGGIGNGGANKGKKYGPQSDETKAKRSAAMKQVPGRVWTEEEKANRSMLQKGKPWSEARRAAQLNRGK